MRSNSTVRWRGPDVLVGAPASVRALFDSLYADLLRVARVHLAKYSASFMFGPTTLVHEAFLRMAGPEVPAFAERTGFVRYASRVMRAVVTDYVRSQIAQKRNRKIVVTLPDDDALHPIALSSELVARDLELALRALTSRDARLAELVDLHFFGGLTFLEIASLRRVSKRTVQREWHKARALLHELMVDDKL